jgi:hypothetical protein
VLFDLMPAIQTAMRETLAPATAPEGEEATAFLGAMADDDVQGPGRQRGRGINHMLQQGLGSEGVQDLGQGGFHPGALACGKDHDVECHGMLGPPGE